MVHYITWGDACTCAHRRTFYTPRFRPVNEVMDSGALLIGEISISLNCSTVSSTFPTIFKSKKAKKDLVEVEGKHLMKKNDKDHNGVTIESFEECKP